MKNRTRWLSLLMVLALVLAQGAVALADDPVALRIYKPLHSNLQQYVAGYEDLPFYKALEEATNTKLSFMTPPVGQETEQFNLILASRDLPDIFYDSWSTYVGGASKAIQDGIIIPLNDLIDEHAPNLKAALEQYPDALKYISTADGDIFAMPVIMESPSQLVTQGALIRQDWLDELGLDMPETIDEWHTVLTAFKEQKGAIAPLVFTLDNFKSNKIIASAYGVSTWNNFYHEDGQVKYGPLEDGFKDYLMTLNQWYEEGLIDPDLATLTNNTRQAKILSGEAGVAHGPTKGALAAWTTTLQETVPEAQMVGVPYPSLNKGETVAMGQVNDPVVPRASISATCTDPVAAIKFLDYGFSEAGHMLLNFGIEGETYTMEDGKAIYTPFIMDSTDVPPLSLLNQYATSPEGNGTLPSIYDVGFIEQMNAYMPQINEALDTWAASNTFEQNLPASVLPLAEDSAQYSSIMNEVITYIDEMFYRFVMGQESFDNYDKFVDQVKSKGAEQALEIMQRAYDSFLGR